MKSTSLVAASALLASVAIASPINLMGRRAQDYPDTTAAYSSATTTPEYYPSTRPTGSWYHPTTTYTNTVGPRPSVAPGTPSVGILCNATATDMSITPNLTLPVGERPVYVVLGRGVQNYACINGTWANQQALATLYDISCLAYNKILLGNISQIAHDFRSITVENNITIWNLPPSLTNLGIGTTFLGHHFFQPNAAGVSAPVFDFRPSGAGDFVQGARNQSAPSPFKATGAVPWVRLDGIAGQAADTFFRVDTTGGALSQTACSSPGSNFNIQYAASYWFYRK